MSNALDKILKERKRQDKKWGEQNHSDEWWLPILVEEVGELSEAMLEAQFGMGGNKNVRQEAIEVAAVALAWVECHERKGKPNGEQQSL